MHKENATALVITRLNTGKPCQKFLYLLITLKDICSLGKGKGVSREIVRCYTVLALELKLQEIITLTSCEKALQKITGKLNYPAE